MNKHTPSKPALAAIAAFTASCVGLLLYLWLSFGGSVPLQSAGYRFTATIGEATLLTEQADVRISGVNVGKVVKLTPAGDKTRVEIQIEPKYAPIPKDTRAILRQKTLLGETYVALSPGRPSSGMLADGGAIPARQVGTTTELDEILRTFDPKTRRQFQAWMQSLGKATDGRGQDLSNAVGNLAPTAEDTSGVLGVLDQQRGAVRRLIRDSGTVFGAVGARESATRRLITAGERVLRTTATRDQALRDTVRITPTFLAELRSTLRETGRTTDELGPTVSALRPVAPLLTPALNDTARFAPDLRAALRELDPTIELSKTGLPATTTIAKELQPLLRRVYPFSRDLIPVGDFTNTYKRDLVQNFGKAVAAAAPTRRDPGSSDPLHYVRILIKLGPESLSAFGSRPGFNRANAYAAPNALEQLGTAGGLLSYSCAGADGGGALNKPCRLAPLKAFRGRTSAYERLTRDGP